MKPLLLEMTAFGSYASKTVIPFDKLDHGLYLITGDTGAGKTTIFDGIMFALYGVASGNDRSKGSAAIMHCDHVPKSVDTEVTLKFTQGGKVYTVSRKLHFRKIRGTADQYGDAVPSAVLMEPDRDPTEGAGKVSARCAEILGLDQNQFRKIIMLAQGEFMQFLKADSDGKMDILSKLFDDSEYLYYQNLFIGARDELGRTRAGKVSELKGLMEVTFINPAEPDRVEDTDDEVDDEGPSFLAGDPKLCDDLSELVVRESDELKQLKAERDKVSKAINKLNTERGAAEEINKQFDELKNNKAHLEKLREEEEKYSKREELMGRAEIALHKVRPAEQLYERAVAALEQTKREIDILTDEVKALDTSLAAAEKAVRSDEPVVKEIEEINTKIDSINSHMPEYSNIRTKQQEREQASGDLEALRKKKSSSEEELESLKGDLSRLKNREKELEGIDARAEGLSNSYKSAKERREQLTGENGIRAEVGAILGDEHKLEGMQQELKTLTGSAIAASDKYNDLYKKFIAGQAGLIADDIRRMIESDNRAVCPVCRTELSHAEVGRLAERSEDTPERSAVDDARDAADSAEKSRSKKQTDVEVLAAEIMKRKEAILGRAGNIMAENVDWDILASDHFLDDEILRAEQQESRLADEYSEAEQLKNERAGCRTKITEIEGAIEDNQKVINGLAEEEKNKEGRIRELDAAIIQIRKGLEYESEEAAVAARHEFTDQRDLKKASVEAHANELKKVKEACDQKKGSLAAKESSISGLSSDAEEARTARDNIVMESGFADAEEARAAMAVIGESDGDVWLSNEKAQISAYRNDIAVTNKQIETLAAMTNGKEYADIEALDTKLDEQGRVRDELNDICNQKESILANHVLVRDKAKGITADLEETSAAWERIRKLAELAEGATGEGGKLSFDRYVMGAVFREIIDMANLRMEQMSGGKYELVHKVGAGRKNAKAGLEIEVLDNNTGLMRSSDSLSGGEKFFTSLALALGLSDVVQNHAGGKQMEALFIDEGFGTLSDEILDRALEVLEQLTDGDRLVGVISHVDRLDESIPQKILVRNGDKGSSIEMLIS